jgi:hypothetical protein
MVINAKTKMALMSAMGESHRYPAKAIPAESHKAA